MSLAPEKAMSWGMPVSQSASVLQAQLITLARGPSVQQTTSYHASVVGQQLAAGEAKALTHQIGFPCDFVVDVGVSPGWVNFRNT